MSDLPKARHLAIEKTDRAVIIVPEASLTGDTETEELLAVLGRLETDSVPVVVLDLSKVEFINSLALGVILSGHVRLSKQGSRLLLCGVGERIRKVLVITKLEGTLRIHGSLEEALLQGLP